VATPTSVQPAAQMMVVTCPPGVGEGQMIQVDAPDGQRMQVSVPPGISSGQQFQVQLPAAAIQVVEAVPIG